MLVHVSQTKSFQFSQILDGGKIREYGILQLITINKDQTAMFFFTSRSGNKATVFTKLFKYDDSELNEHRLKIQFKLIQVDVLSLDPRRMFAPDCSLEEISKLKEEDNIIIECLFIASTESNTTIEFGD